MSAQPAEVTELLAAWSQGDRGSGEIAIASLYADLRRLAGHYLAGERTGHTLEPTALVHEAFLRLAGQRGTSWESRSHFVAFAATSMRRVLVDHARARHRAKRGGFLAPVPLEQAEEVAARGFLAVIEIDRALERLTALDPEKARVVELRVFAGLSVEETAAALGCSAATVTRHWRIARAWLVRQLRGA